MKLNKKIYIIFFVFLIVAVCASLFLLREDKKAYATTTPLYTLTYDYEWQNDRTGAVVRGTTTSIHNYSLTLSGSSFSSSRPTLQNDFIIDFSDITISASHNSTYKLYNSSNTLVSSGTLPLSSTLSDGYYKLSATTHSLASIVNYLTATVTFTVDTTAPTISISCGDNGFSKNNVTVTFSDNINVASAAFSRSTGGSFPSSAATSFSSGKTFTDEGNYTLKVTDSAGNSTTKYFTIDKTAPSLSLAGVTNSGFTNGNVSASWTTTASGATFNRTNSNDVLTVKYSRSTTSSFPTSATTTYNSGTTLSDEGNYLITISDSAGNSKEYKFTIDKTAPSLSLAGVTNSGFTNGNVSASWSTTVGNVGAQLTNSNDVLTVKYSRSTTSSFPTSATTAYSSALSLEGNYRIEINDAAGNITSYTFTIDKTAPSLSLAGVTDGGFTNGSVSASWSTAANGATYNRTNSNDVLTVKYSRSTTSSFPTSASTTYSSGTTLSDEGNYLITISDSAGNSKDYKFTIDKTAPSLSLAGVTNGGFTKSNVSASWSTTPGNVGAQLTNSNDSLLVQYSISNNADFPSNAKIVYTSGAALTAEGNYRIEISDAAGNSSFLVFTIDKTAPTFSLSTSDNSSFINDRTAQNVSASWNKTLGGKGTQRVNANDVLTMKYSRSTTSSFPSSADTIYTEETIINTEGKYRFELTDKAGNSYTKQFEIYRQSPTFIVYSASGEELSQTPLAYNKDIKVSFANCTARLNNKPYSSGTIISDEGEYAFILTDELGNTASATIYIIKTLPTLNYDRLHTPINRWYETTDSTGKVYSFASYDTAYAVADERERSLISGGVWTNTNWDGGVPFAPEDVPIAAQGMAYYVYKAYDSASIKHAYFSIATLNKAIENYVTSSISIKYTPLWPAQAAEGEVVYRDIYFSKDAITFNRINNCTLYVDGTVRNYPFTLTEIGQHNIVERDIAGNTVSYSVIVDAAAPIVRVTNLNGNMPEALSYGTPHYFTYGIRIYLDDIDEQAILRIKDEATQKEEYYLGGVVELRAAGTYTILARDAAGNSGNLSIYISLIEPTIDIKENEVVEVVNSFTVAINKNYSLNTINNLTIQKFDNDESWVTLTADNSSSPVTINRNTLTYMFDISGTYRIIVVDVFGRYIEKEYSFIKGSPKGTLSTTGGTVLTSGDSTRSNIYFTWSNMLDCSAEISVNGAEPISYAKGTIITTEGSYSIKLYSNKDDVFNVYMFTIDKTAPSGVLTANGTELPNGTTTRHPVILSWEEDGCTATLNGEPYANGSAVAEEGDYTIELFDKAGNKRSYSFRIKTTPPKVTLSTVMGKIANYDVTKYDVYVSWNERNCVCLVNGAPYNQNTKINVENSYTVILTDAFGNSTSCFFSIDKTAPSGQLYVDGQEVATSTTIFTNKKVNFIWAELGCSATINDDFIYTSGSIIAEDGIYTIKLSDAAGNVSSYDFIIKTSSPKAKLLTNGEEVASGARTRHEARLTWTEAGCTATVNGEPYSKGSLITAEGDYTFVLLDSYGNSDSWQISIDKTAPVITLTSNGDYLTNGEITRFDVCYNWDDEKATATLNGHAVEMGTVAEEEGEYTLIVTDDVGNKTSIVFIIDKTAKAGTLIANSTILESGSITRYSAYYTWNGSSYIVTLNGEPYSKGSLITAEGDYLIELTDKAGNKSTVQFTVDKTPAVGALHVTKNDTVFPLENGVATNGNVHFEWEEEDCTATLNGQPYELGALITAEGDYRIILTDKAGNTATYTFTIDKTAPKAKAHTASNEIIEDAAITRYSIYFDWTEAGCTATVNGEPYSNGNLISDTGIYTFALSDAVGNVVYLTIEVYKIIPNAEIVPTNNFVLPYLNDGFTITWEEEDCTATLNGQSYEKETKITDEGEYTFILVNKVGLEFVENIIIDKTPPTATIYDTDGNLVTSDVCLSFVYFTWEEANCTATVNGEPYKAKTYLTKDGDYTLTLTDAAGNSGSFSIKVARTKPSVSLVKSSGDELSNGGSTTESVVIILTSAADATITVDEINYTIGDAISDVGTHTVVVTDVYGNVAEYSFTIKETTAQRDNANPYAGIAKGSPVGTYILLALIAVIVIVAVLVPLIRAKRKGAFRSKLK